MISMKSDKERHARESRHFAEAESDSFLGLETTIAE